jgi:hypothetical protein
LQDVWDKKFDGYFNESMKCEKDKQCWDAAWERNGLADPKYEVMRK